MFSKAVSHSRLSVVDQPTENVFTATLREAEVGDSGTYWCAVLLSGYDPYTHLYLQVTEAEAKLRVSSQSVSGYEGGNLTVLCHGASRWYRIGRDGADPARTAVDADGGAVLSVRLWKLQKEDSGWYCCSDHDSQMPVHLTVMEAPDITRCTPTSSLTPTLPGEDRTFLWLFILGPMLAFPVCGAVILIRARNKRKQRAETSGLHHDDKNKQHLLKKTLNSGEVTSENLYEFKTENKPNAQENAKNHEVSCEDLYESMTENKPNAPENAKNNEVSCENIYESMTENNQNTRWEDYEVPCEDLYETMTGTKWENDMVACEDIYETMNGIKQNPQRP
ncbi:uncharacterized protein LOC122330196 [Puntigrus tetrazona]|uniref:uncharacterized protein LOC122330196 n=1 Tax=Puntigrus tetrazona TaxID=1606681 RepID=UPI001C897370|nr:uncharacterized protein LOC122330196 [Puntigrus tetrazona]